MKKLLVVILALVLALSLAACNGSGSGDSGDNKEPENSTQGTDGDGSEATSGGKVGVSMPTKSLQRWNQDGDNIKKQLEEAGYTVDLQYAGDNDTDLQVTQLENMISGGCKVLIVAAVNGEKLGSALPQAKEEGVKVIAYDRLIMNSDAVSYYATFDNTKVGALQGQFIADSLKLSDPATKGPFNIELFTGDPGDNNVNFFFNGAMDVLKPYMDSGKLVVLSKQTEKAQCTTVEWNTEKSQSRMENLISAQKYGPKDTKLDAVLSSNDSVAQGVTNALVDAGYNKDNFPVLTGQDCDVASMKNMLKGLQTMSVFKDTRTLAARAVMMVDAILKGSEPEINDRKTYNNGTGIIPTYLEDPLQCTLDNYKELLIDSGYYKEAQLQ